MGPTGITTVGRSAETAAMICAGSVLSQPPITTTASIGCARIISSVSMAIRLRRYIEVGCAKLSAIEMVCEDGGGWVNNARGEEDGIHPPAPPPRQHHPAFHRLDDLRHVAMA